MWGKKKLQSDEYIKLEGAVSALRLRFTDMELELALILKKLKFKYKITKRDLAEDEKTEDISSSVLLPE